MSKLLGVIFLVVGGVMLYRGWQSHDAVSPNGTTVVVTGPAGSESVWLLTLGAVAVIWGLIALFRRSV